MRSSSSVHEPIGTVPIGAHPSALVPHQPGRAPEQREVDQLDRGSGP